MIVLLKEVKQIFESDIKQMSEYIEILDNKTLLAKNEAQEALIFEEAEQTRLQLERRRMMIAKIDNALNPEMQMSEEIIKTKE